MWLLHRLILKVEDEKRIWCPDLMFYCSFVNLDVLNCNKLGTKTTIHSWTGNFIQLSSTYCLISTVLREDVRKFSFCPDSFLQESALGNN